MPAEAIVAASRTLFNDVPLRSPGTLAFAPIVDGDLVPDYPVKLAREGRSHPVPLIIGTNKHEAALFKWMKSPLMPITPEAIRDVRRDRRRTARRCSCPTEDQIGTVVSQARRTKARGMGVARDVGFRMPSVWLAEGHSAVAPVYLYRFDWATPMLKAAAASARPTPPNCPIVWGNLVAGPKDPTFKLGGLEDRRGGVGANAGALGELRRPGQADRAARRTGVAAVPRSRSRMPDDRPARRVVNDIDLHIRATWGSQVLSFR